MTRDGQREQRLQAWLSRVLRRRSLPRYRVLDGILIFGFEEHFEYNAF